MPGGRYVTALSLRWLTPFYDALVERPMTAFGMRRGLLESLGPLSGKRLLDIGCGTGTFLIMLQHAFPDAQLDGVDGDPQIPETARGKAGALGLNIVFSEAMSYSMPYPDASFDAVTTTLMLHHLDREAKKATAREMYRVLKPGGLLAGLDFGEPRGPLGRGLRPITRHFERVADNLDGFLPVMFEQAGFTGYTELSHYILDSVALFRAARPQASQIL